MRSADVAVRSWVVAHRSPLTTQIFTVFTLLGSREILTPVALLVAWGIFRPSWRELLLLAFCALLAGSVVAALKRDFGVSRPLGGLEAGLGFSFPSGHSAGAMSVAVVLSYLALRRQKATPALPIACLGFAVLVGVSRVMLDLHWTSDVVGGWVVGAAFGAGASALFELLDRNRTKAVSGQQSAVS